MKIYILADLKVGAWGGGNQFLSRLSREFEKRQILAKQWQRADVILYDSYQKLPTVLQLKKNNTQKYIVHRLGPVFYYHRGVKWLALDKLVAEFSRHVDDLVIFQSEWSRAQFKQLGLAKQNWAVVGNAADPVSYKQTAPRTGKIKLLAASWSDNKNKGFSYLSFLDENLDWTKYSLDFIGHAPNFYKNITTHEPVAASMLGQRLGEFDIFIAPYRFEACSNMILEAQAAGLPVVALDSGANSEVIAGGELFHTSEQLLKKLEQVSHELSHYQLRAQAPTVKTSTDKYVKAISELVERQRPRRLSLISYYQLRLRTSLVGRRLGIEYAKKIKTN